MKYGVIEQIRIFRGGKEGGMRKQRAEGELGGVGRNTISATPHVRLITPCG